jgi:hypothetical protein
MASIIGTFDTLCVSLIVAVSMEHTFVPDLFPSTLAFGSDVIYLNTVSILKEQATPAAFSPLFLKKLSQHPVEHRVVS